MRISKESESYRLEMLRRLQEVDRDAPPPEVLEAEQVIAKYREEKAIAGAAIPRLHTELPEPDMCPKCYYLHGRASFLIALESGPQVDRMRCSVCGYVEERNMGL